MQLHNLYNRLYFSLSGSSTISLNLWNEKKRNIISSMTSTTRTMVSRAKLELK